MENGVQNKLLTFFFVSLSSTFFAEEYEKQTWFGDPNLQGVWTNASLTTLERPDYFETLEISEEAVLAAKKSYPAFSYRVSGVFPPKVQVITRALQNAARGPARPRKPYAAA